MKWLIYILVIFLSFELAAQQEIRVDASHQSISLEDLFNSWNKTYDTKISFSVDLTSELYVSCNFKDKPLSEAIQEVTQSVGFDFELIGNNYLIIPPSKSDKPARYDFTIKGKVMDGISNETLPYALVQVDDTKLGTTTDNDGFFVISDIPSDTLTLEISYLGFEIRKLRLSEIQDLNKIEISLSSSNYNISEVVVLGDRVAEVDLNNSSGRMSLNPQIRNRLPSLGDPDVFRTIQLLPGISGSNGTSAELSIRGSAPGENLVLLDGYTLYHLDHFYGVFSAVNSDYVKDARVYKNPIDAKYGGRVSGVVDLIGKDGNKKGTTGSLGLNLLTAKGSVEVPVSDKLTFLAYGRRSHTDLVRSKIFKDIYQIVRKNRDNNQADLDFDPFQDITPDFHFYDVNTKLSYDFSDNTSITASWYKSEDKLRNEISYEYEEPDGGVFTTFTNNEFEDNSWGNNGFSLALQHRWSKGSASMLQVTTSRFFNNYFYGFNSEELSQFFSDSYLYSFEQDNQLYDLGVDLQHNQIINNNLKWTSGYSMHEYSIDLLQAYDNETFTDEENQYESISSIFSNLTGKYNRHSFEVGARIEYSEQINRAFAQPRFSYNFDITRNLKFKAGFSRNFQFIKQVQYFDPVYGYHNFWLAADDEELDITRADHFSAGFNFFDNGWTIDIEAYNKSLNGISEFFVPETFAFDDTDRGELINGFGNTKGLDLLIQREHKNYTGWISYSLMNAQQGYEDINNGDYFPSMQDRRHEFKWINTLQIGRYNFALNWIYGSGAYFPVYEFEEISDNFFPAETETIITRVYDEESRLPAFHRMDLTAARKWKHKKMHGEFGVTIFNLYNQQNIKSRRISLSKIEYINENPSSNLDPYVDLNLLPFTPSFFVNINFR